MINNCKKACTTQKVVVYLHHNNETTNSQNKLDTMTIFERIIKRILNNCDSNIMYNNNADFRDQANAWFKECIDESKYSTFTAGGEVFLKQDDEYQDQIEDAFMDWEESFFANQD